MTNQLLNMNSRAFWVLLLLAVLPLACAGSGVGSINEATPTPTPTPTLTPTPLGGIFIGTTTDATITPTATQGGGGTSGHHYLVTGESNGVSFYGEICSLEEPFTIDGTFPGGSASTLFTPSSSTGGDTAMSGGGGGCTQTGEGTYTVIFSEDDSGTLTWTDSATLTCPDISNERIATFELPLQPDLNLLCP